MPEAKDYSAIAAAKIKRPSERKRPKNLLIYGSNKKGKTRMAASAGIAHTLLLDPEHGTDLMLHLDPNVWDIESWEELDDFYNYMKVEGCKRYRWVADIGLTRIHNMALRYIMGISEERDLTRKPGIVDRRDHGKAGELTKGFITNMHNLPIGVIFTAQEKTTKAGDDDPPDFHPMTIPDIPDGPRKHVNSLVDCIGRIYIEEVDVKVRKGDQEFIEPRMMRKLRIGPHEDYDTGYRSDFELPEVINNPTIPKLVTLMETGELPKPKPKAKPKAEAETASTETAKEESKEEAA